MARLNKQVAIARSGVYEYSPGALPGLGLSVPPEKKTQRSFRVFRPPELLIRVKDKFSRLPVTLEHPNRLVDGNNFRELAMGYTGDNVGFEYMPNKVDIRILSTLTLADNEAISAYYRGIIEVSPGYKGVFVWDSGTTPTGEAYDIIMQDITEVNHLALTRQGRGGVAACVLDSREVIVKKKKSGLFYAIAKKLNGVNDSKEDGFVSELAELVKTNRKLDDDQIGKSVASLLDKIDPLPDSEDKTKLVTFVEDLIGVKDESDESVVQASVMIGNLYAVLDKQALESIVTDAMDKEPANDAGPPKKEEAAPTEDKEEGGKPPSSTDGKEGSDNDEGDALEEEDQGTPDTALDKPSVGPDDAIFDKKFDELTKEEKDFLWSELMATLKSHSLDEKQAEEVPMAGKVEEEKKEEVKPEGEVEKAKPEDKLEDKKVEDSVVADVKPEETVVEDSLMKEKKQKEKDAAKAAVLDSATEPRYPDGTVIDGKSAVHKGGLDVDKLFDKLSRRD
jgi:hypothetical protein